MQFLVIGRDGTDDGALERRLAARQAHLESLQRLKNNGEVLFGAALLDESERMIGSVMLVSFESRAALDSWLAAEPYVTSRVWQSVEVNPCKVPPLFLNS